MQPRLLEMFGAVSALHGMMHGVLPAFTARNVKADFFMPPDTNTLQWEFISESDQALIYGMEVPTEPERPIVVFFGVFTADDSKRFYAEWTRVNGWDIRVPKPVSGLIRKRKLGRLAEANFLFDAASEAILAL